jgi:CRP/FNR family cyclic AMP-dependent transcriptional regulator
MKSKEPLMDKTIRSIPFFSVCSDEELKELRSVVTEKFFNKNEIILLEEDTGNYMYVILSGKVKAVHVHAEGNEHILAVHARGDFFGEMALLDGMTEPATVVAMEDTHILILSKKNFDQYLVKNEKALRQVILVLCSRLREAWMMHKVLSLPHVEDKLRTLLRLIGMQHGVRDQRGIIVVTKLTHQEIASYASVSRETVSRFLNKLEKDGEIEILEDKRILLKSPALITASYS